MEKVGVLRRVEEEKRTKVEEKLLSEVVWIVVTFQEGRREQ